MTPDGPVILGLETSCDETSAAIIQGNSLRGLVVHSQDEHEVYGGVVPEIAARAHIERVDQVVGLALERAETNLEGIDAVAVTAGPGLIGALLVGVCWAKSLAWARRLPLIPVHHMEAHLFGVLLEHPDLEPPFVALLVSGGHTLLIDVRTWGDYHLLGGTRDDAAGEAFDKVAKLLGLAYPGGPAIETASSTGDPKRYRFPRPMLRSDQGPEHPSHFDFSFSGLKTAVVTEVAGLEAERLSAEVPHLAASFQEAAVDTLVGKTLRALALTGRRTVVLGGGVSANQRLRNRMSDAVGPVGRVFYSSPRLSVDNGAMIARAGLFRLERGDVGGPSATADAQLPFPGLTRRGGNVPRTAG